MNVWVFEGFDINILPDVSVLPLSSELLQQTSAIWNVTVTKAMNAKLLTCDVQFYSHPYSERLNTSLQLEVACEYVLL